MSFIRNTRQRTAITRVFENAQRPLGPEEIMHAASEEVPNIGLTTVYRNIKLLLGEGVISLVEVPGEPPRYQSSSRESGHHFHCRACGRLFRLKSQPSCLRDMISDDFHYEGFHLTLKGLCPECMCSQNTVIQPITNEITSCQFSE